MSTTSLHLNPVAVSGPAFARSDFCHAHRDWTPSALKEGQPFRLRRLPLIRPPRGLGLPRDDPQRPNQLRVLSQVALSRSW